MYELLKSWSQIAPAFTFIAAVIAVFVAWRQFALNRANQRETTAKAIFREYLKLAFENPDLAAGDYQSLPPAKREQYEWFVGYFLWAAEEILDYAKNDPTWEINLELNAKRHLEYFRNDKRFNEIELRGYRANVRNLIERVIWQSPEPGAVTMSEAFRDTEFKEISASIRHYGGLRYLIVPIFIAIQGGVLIGLRDHLVDKLGTSGCRWLVMIFPIAIATVFITIECSLNNYVDRLVAIAKKSWPHSFWNEVYRSRRLVNISICSLYAIITAASCIVLLLAMHNP
jgi:hypothetical protein